MCVTPLWMHLAARSKHDCSSALRFGVYCKTNHIKTKTIPYVVYLDIIICFQYIASLMLALNGKPHWPRLAKISIWHHGRDLLSNDEYSNSNTVETNTDRQCNNIHRNLLIVPNLWQTSYMNKVWPFFFLFILPSCNCIFMCAPHRPQEAKVHTAEMYSYCFD